MKARKFTYHYIITIFAIYFNVLIIIFPKEIIKSAKNGLLLWYNFALPSLLPFIIRSVLCDTNLNPAGCRCSNRRNFILKKIITKAVCLLCAGALVLGAVLIALGANLLVDNGTLIAQALGVPESVIALTFVALGTSLPELVTAITSLAKGHGALSLGNVIGANVFNLVLVSGVSVTLAPFSIPQNSTIAGMNASLVMDIPVMFAVMLLLTVPALIKGKLSRPQGIALLCIYAAFCAVQFSI